MITKEIQENKRSLKKLIDKIDMMFDEENAPVDAPEEEASEEEAEESSDEEAQ